MKASNVVVTTLVAAFCALAVPSAQAGMLIAGSPSGIIYDIDPANRCSLGSQGVTSGPRLAPMTTWSAS